MPVTKFEREIRANMERLIDRNGFSYFALMNWITGRRKPKYETALRLSKLLDLPIESIPYRRVEVNEPRR